MAFETAQEERQPVVRIIPAIVALTLIGGAAFFMTSLVGHESNLVIYAVVAAILYVLTLFDIRIGLFVTIAAIAMSPEFGAGGARDLRIEDFLIPVLLFAWITRREEQHETGLRGPMFLYIAVSLFSSMVAILMATVEPLRAILITLKFAEYFVLLYLVANIVRSEEEVRFFTFAFVLIGVVTALQSVYLWGGEGGANVPVRLAGPSGETANIFAGYLTMITAMSIGLFVQAQGPRQKLLLSASMCVLFYATMVTFSRTGYVALFVGLLIFGVFKRRQILVLCLVGVVLFATIAPASVWHRASTILGVFTGDAPSSYQARVNAWESSAKYDFISSPIWGNGPGSRPFSWVDNEYFRVLIDLGIIGVIALLWLLFRLVRTSNQAYNLSEEGSFERGLCGGYLLAILCMMIHAWGATSFTSIRTMESFMVLSGLFLTQWRLIQERAGHAGGRPDLPDYPRLVEDSGMPRPGVLLPGARQE